VRDSIGSTVKLSVVSVLIVADIGCCWECMKMRAFVISRSFATAGAGRRGEMRKDV
jgi:hypothetical protein